eukprot:Lithocolla_globosa_v1_NODE_6321_length_1104_cov_530.849380.p1 type:complete len:327 gc:universal NODE_6321_length_1104_cov_530.849380:1036-56(-)
MNSDDEIDAYPVTIEQTSPEGPVGFDNITQQLKYKQLKQGFEFNMMVCGQTGLGKSTFVNSLFKSKVLESKGTTKSSQAPRKTTEIERRSHQMSENGVNFLLTIVDCPGFGDQLNNDRCWEHIVKFIQEQYHSYHKEESSINRKRHIKDRRIHVCLYFLAASKQLKPLDIETMKYLGQNVNLVPVIAKADSLTMQERLKFKKRVKTELEFHNIRVFPMHYTELVNDWDKTELAANKIVENLIPFAVISSESNATVDGKEVKGRTMPWGTINITDREHAEFEHLRDFLLTTHLQDLIDTTKFIHYETYRVAHLNSKKDKKAKASGKK